MSAGSAWEDPPAEAMEPTLEQIFKRREAECLAAGKAAETCFMFSKDRDNAATLDLSKDPAARAVPNGRRAVRMVGKAARMGELQAARAHRGDARSAMHRPARASTPFIKGPSAALFEAPFAEHSINRPLISLTDPSSLLRGTGLDLIRAKRH